MFTASLFFNAKETVIEKASVSASAKHDGCVVLASSSLAIKRYADILQVRFWNNVKYTFLAPKLQVEVQSMLMPTEKIFYHSSRQTLDDVWVDVVIFFPEILLRFKRLWIFFQHSNRLLVFFILFYMILLGHFLRCTRACIMLTFSQVVSHW